MMTMSTARVGLQNVDIKKVLSFLEILTNAEQLKNLTRELDGQIELARAEQAKALEYAGRAEKLREADAVLERANATNQVAAKELAKCNDEARTLLDNASKEAAKMLRDAREEVQNLRGDIDRDVQAAADSLESAKAKEKAAEELHAQAAHAHEQALERQTALEQRIERLQSAMTGVSE